MKHSVIAVNITWNRYRWQKAYTDPRAGHSYARKHPGHESLNFYFNKKGIDTKTHIYGFSQWRYYPKDFSDGGYVVFYTRNLDSSETQIVGIYGDVEILNPARRSHYRGFENNSLLCNMKASRDLSLLLPLPLDAKKYARGRMVGQVGFTYYDEDIVQRIVSDEYKSLALAGGFPYNSFDILDSIHYRISGKHLSKKSESKIQMGDLEEQNEIEKIERQRATQKILDELRNLKPTDPEQIEIRNKVYKRDNKTIVQLKIVRGYKCQICGTSIIKRDGSPYIEAAHITPKHRKGNELPNNIILLCPNHHKEFDLGKKEILTRDENALTLLLNGKRYSIDLQI
ncbi:MAG: HNH endonuclease [Nitrospirota bacterium]